MFFRRAKEPKGPARSGLPCGKARDLSRRERCFFSLLALAGLPCRLVIGFTSEVIFLPTYRIIVVLS